MLIVYRVMLHLKPGSMINDKLETYFAFDNNTFKNFNKCLTCYKQYVTYDSHQMILNKYHIN